MMSGRRVLHAILAVLLFAVSLAATGCAPGRQEYPIGNDVWVWEQKGSAQQITLNEKLFAVIQNGTAHVSLPPDGRSATVTLDAAGEPVTVKVPWGVTLTQADYTLINTALHVHGWQSGVTDSGNLVWVILLLVVIVAGLLVFLYAGRIVDSWKLGGIFSGHDTAKSLLVFKALGILLIAAGGIVLLMVLF